MGAQDIRHSKFVATSRVCRAMMRSCAARVWRQPLVASSRPASLLCNRFVGHHGRSVVADTETKHDWSCINGGITLVGLGLATAFVAQSPQAACEGGSTGEVKLVTYNVLSPLLGRPSQFPTCKPEDVEAKNRFPRILERLEKAAADGTVIALQEVDLEWAGKLHTFFAEHDYCAVFGQYGSAFSGYMGVMVAWPRQKYEVKDVEISRVSDTASKGLWPKSNKIYGPTHYGTLTKNELKEVIGCYPPSVQAEFDEWGTARERKNEALFVKLQPRGSTKGSFVVSTYHMPCLFGSAPKVRVMNIHIHLLLARLKMFANGDPVVLMGDFNIKPNDSAYQLAASGGDLAAASAWPEEIKGLPDRLPAGPVFPGGLASAYRAYHGSEPVFTNYARNPGQKEDFCECLDYIFYSPSGFKVTACPGLPPRKENCDGPFPSKKEPSDHVALYATLELK